MKAEITSEVIQDLLPLYLAGEVSADTAILVEEYLKTDPEMEKITRQTKKDGLLGQVPVPLSKEDAMEAYVKATQRMMARMLAMSALGVVVVLGIVMLVLYFVFGLR